jgi:tetratricopeptide (TPR) repeat protein
VCLKCLAKEPGKRYASAEALADDLDRFLDGLPILARPVPAWERAWKAARRRPAAAVGLAASVLSLVLVVAVVLIANARLQRERDDADAARRSADARRLEAIAAKEALERERQMAFAGIRKASEAVERMMSRVTSEQWVARPELEDERRKVLEDAVAVFRSFVWKGSGDPVTRREAAVAYMRVAAAYLALGKYPECRESVEESARLRQGLAAEFPLDPGHTRDLAESVGFLGRLAAVFGKYDDAYGHYESAVGLAQLALKLDPTSDETKLVLAESYSALGQFVESTDHATAVEYHLRARLIGEELAAQPNAPYRHRLAMATALVHLGVMDLMQRLDRGYELLEQARALVEVLDREAAPTARAQEQFGLTRAALHLYRGEHLVRSGERAAGMKAADAGMDGLDAILARHRLSFPLRAQKLRFLLLYADLQHQAGRRLAARTAYEEFAKLRADLLKEFPHMTWLARMDLVKESHFLVIKARDGDGEGVDKTAKKLLEAAAAQAQANSQSDLRIASVIKYNWACAHAQLVLSGPEEDREWHAARSVAILNELLGERYFEAQGMVAHFEADSDFHPLRGRPDFQRVLTRVKNPPQRSGAQVVPAGP